jgi:hypothetical protein
MGTKQTGKAKFDQEQLLDEALEETFPASDPISMQQLITVGRVARPLHDEAPGVKKAKKS